MSHPQISVNFNVLFSWHCGGNADPERSGPEKVCHKSEGCGCVSCTLSIHLMGVGGLGQKTTHTQLYTKQFKARTLITLK